MYKFKIVFIFSNYMEIRILELQEVVIIILQIMELVKLEQVMIHLKHLKNANPVKTQGNQWNRIVEQNQAGKSVSVSSR